MTTPPLDLAAAQARAEQAMALADKATPGPWSIESCGEKGDGANMIGVAFGPNDNLCRAPRSGWLEPYDDDGKEIEYYRDELIAVCDHTNRNPGYDGAFIADARTSVPDLARLVLDLVARVREVEGQLEEAKDDVEFWRNSYGDCYAAWDRARQQKTPGP